jgi:hypothetical protein
MRLVLLALCTLPLLYMDVTSAAGERVYRWKGPDGKIYYGDTPPLGAQDVRNFDRRFAGPAEPPPSPPLTGEQAAAREAKCANMRGQLKTYRNAVRLVERDALGREHEYTTEERQQLIAKVESDIQNQCGEARPE